MGHPDTLLRPSVPSPERAKPLGAPETPQGRRGKRRLELFLLFGAVLSLAVFLVGWLFFSPLTVSVVPVETNVREQVYGLGVVGARVQSNVTFKVAGVLVDLKADQGDRVRAGQVLARLDARDVEAQLALTKAGVGQARANIDKAKADVASAAVNLANAKAIAARRARLIAQDSTSEEEAQTTEANARAAAASLVSLQSQEKVAEAALQSAEAQEAFEAATLSYYTLYAPYDAWIISRNLELGSAVSPYNANQSMFTLVEAKSVWAVGYVDERLAGRLRVGQPAEILLRSSPSRRLAGHVERIEIQSDPVNEERLVDVAFDHIPDDIHLAEQAYVYITTGILPRARLVQPAEVSDFRGDMGVGGHGDALKVDPAQALMGG